MKADSDSSFVVDASVAVAWVYPDHATDYSNSALKAFLSGSVIHAPQIWPLEVTNALVVLFRREKLTLEEREEAMGWLSKLPVAIDDQGTNQTFARIPHIALQFGLSAYDATYLELAARGGLALACKDGALREAASKARVKIWRPAE
jgi:predicted nucleic acid-binding protein